MKNLKKPSEKKVSTEFSSTTYTITRYEEYLDKKVYIKPLKLEGRIKEISITTFGVKYLIRYFYNMQIHEAYVCADEIEIIGSKI